MGKSEDSSWDTFLIYPFIVYEIVHRPALFFCDYQGTKGQEESCVEIGYDRNAEIEECESSESDHGETGS